VWFQRVLTDVARTFGLSFGIAKGADPPSAEIQLYQHSAQFARERLASFRGSHMVRDPRDIVVSAYFYHLWSSEEWLHIPRSDFAGKTYQEYLRSLDRDEGLAAEIRRAARGVIADMARWDYAQPEFIEVRYEDLMADEPRVFARVFQHYGFSDDAIERSVRIASRYSFTNVAGRRVGDVREGMHLRSGEPGQWRKFLTAAHRRLFVEETGDALDRLGYASDMEM
jgi:sulfotransferase family protein